MVLPSTSISLPRPSPGQPVQPLSQHDQALVTALLPSPCVTLERSFLCSHPSLLSANREG